MVPECSGLAELIAPRVGKVVVISPHPDDAVWSCGGYLAALTGSGERACILTVFDGDPPGSDHHTARERRAEDLRAAAYIGADRVSLGFPEAAYRGYASPLARLRAPWPEDNALTEAIVAAIEETLSEARHVLVPVADGTHVDHVVVRRAVSRCYATAPAPWELTGYAEFPYRPPAVPAGKPLIVPFQPWLEASLAYASQVSAMFGNASRFEAKLRKRYLARGDEAEWIPYAFIPRSCQAPPKED